jgi:uncharacterized protein DUF1573
MSQRSRIVAVPAVLALFGLAGAALGQAVDKIDAPKPQQPPPADIQPAQPPAQPAATVPSGPQPKIVLDKMEHEFGRISDEQEVSVEFPFRNDGQAPLIFKDQPRASCGCTAGKLEKLEFAPGEGGKLTVKFNPHGKHGDQNQKVIANTNDPLMPEVTCKFHCLVRQTIVIEPPLVGFGEVLAGQTAKQVVKIKGPKDFAVTYASNTKGRYITTKVIETHEATLDGEPGSESLVEFTLKDNAPRGPIQAMTTARTTNPKHSLVDIQVNAEIVGDLQVLPPRVNVGVMEGGQQFTKSFKVQSRTEKPFKIKSVEQKTSTTPAPVMTTITQAEPGKESAYMVEVRGMAPQAGTPVMATLVVTMEQGGVEEKQEVQVQGVVRMPTPAMPAGGTPTPGDNQPPSPGVFQPPAPAPAPADGTKPGAARPMPVRPAPVSPAPAPAKPGAK